MADNQDIVDAINTLATSLNGKLGDEAKEQKERDKKQEKGIWKTAKEVPVVGKAVKVGYQQMTAALNQSLKLQEKSLGRGMSLGKVMNQQATTTNNLSNNMVGYGKAISLAYEKAEAGTNRSVAATDKLAAYTNLTGGNSLKLRKEMAQLNMGMDMSADQEKSLSQSMMSLSQGFGMTTEELMNAIQGLEKSMPMYKILGIGPEIAEATARLGAALGQESGQMASDIMTAFTSAEGAVLASQLGVMGERNALLNKEGDTTKAALKMVEAAGSEAARMYESYLAGTGDPAIAYKAVSDALGPAMAQSALTYQQLENQAKAQGKTMSQYMKSVAEQKDISNEFTSTWAAYKDAVFGPLVEGVMKLSNGLFTVLGWLRDAGKTIGINDLAARIGQLVVVMGLAVAAWKAKGIVDTAKGALSAAAGGGSKGGGKGLGGGIAGSLKRLGSGMGGLGKGFGQMMQKGFKGLAKGLTAMGKGSVLKGVAAVLLLSLALIPFGYALNLMKGVGWDTFFILGAGMLALTLAVAAIGAIMMSGVGAVAIIAGAAAFAILAIALVPLGYALQLAGTGFLLFATGLEKITGEMVTNLGDLIITLPKLALALLAFTAGGLVSGFLSLMSGEGPVEKIVKMGKAAKHINKMADSLKLLPKLFGETASAMARISLGPFIVLAMGLAMIRAELSKFGVMDMAKMSLLGKAVGGGGPQAQAAGGGGPQNRSEALRNWGDKSQEAGGMSARGGMYRGNWHGTAEGDIAGNLDAKRAKGQFLRFEQARAEGTASKVDDQIVAERIRDNKKMISLLEAILESQGEGNEQRNTGNRQRQEQVARTNRTTSLGQGRVGASADEL
jgi:hypothetical protein